MSTEIDSNPRGIPRAPFIDDVEAHVGGPDAEVDSTLKKFQEAIAKYRYMELNLNQKKKGLLEKIPDIRKTLDMVKYLKSRRSSSKAADDSGDLEDEDNADAKPFKTTFELNDTLYVEAELIENDTVYLWLGANVMLSYKLDQAEELLSSKLGSAKTTLENTTEDLEYLREQITVMEVNTARCYNWDVKRRRDARVAAGATGGLTAVD